MYNSSKSFPLESAVVEASVTDIETMPLRFFFLLISTAVLSVLARAELRFERTAVLVKAGTEDRMLKAEFPFKNSGAGTVFVAGITTSCPCTTATADRPNVSPGEEGVVNVVYKVGVEDGRQTQTITLLTNEGGGTSYVLTLAVDVPKRVAAELPPVVRVAPALLFWSKKPYATKTVTVDLRGIDGAVLSVGCESTVFRVSTAEAKERNEAVISVTPAESATEATGELAIVVRNVSGQSARQIVPLNLISR